MKNRGDEIQPMATFMVEFDCHDAHAGCGRSHGQSGRSIHKIDGRIEKWKQKQRHENREWR